LTLVIRIFFSHIIFILPCRFYFIFKQIDSCVSLRSRFWICDNGRPGFYKQFAPVNY